MPRTDLNVTYSVIYKNSFNQKCFYFNNSFFFFNIYICLYCLHWLVPVFVIVFYLFTFLVCYIFFCAIAFSWKYIHGTLYFNNSKFEMLTFPVNDVWKCFRDTYYKFFCFYTLYTIKMFYDWKKVWVYLFIYKYFTIYVYIVL